MHISEYMNVYVFVYNMHFCLKRDFMFLVYCICIHAQIKKRIEANFLFSRLKRGENVNITFFFLLLLKT